MWETNLSSEYTKKLDFFVYLTGIWQRAVTNLGTCAENSGARHWICVEESLTFPPSVAGGGRQVLFGP